MNSRTLMEKGKTPIVPDPNNKNNNAPSCELFCDDTGCPCMKPWEYRCTLQSCKACTQCDTLYNCMTKDTWSTEKQAWCCTNKNLGCAVTPKPPVIMDGNPNRMR